MQETHSLSAKIAQAYQLAEQASAQGVIPYLSQVVIDSRPEPRPFRDIAQPWQWQLAHRFAGPVESVAGVRNNYNGKMRLFCLLAKGHDKSSLIGRLTSWALAFSRNAFHGYVFAKDRDQSGYLLEAMQNEVRLNPWLERRISFKNWKAEGPQGSTVTIMAVDAAGTQGIRGDLLICDELTAWDENKGEDFFQAIISGASKRRTGAFIIISNCGVEKSWQHDVWLRAKNSPLWYTYQAPGRLNTPWMSEEGIADDTAMMSPSMVRRLFYNEWVSDTETSYLSREQAEACYQLGIDMKLRQAEEGKPGIEYYGGVDFGSVKDRCVLSIIHKEAKTDVVVIDRMDVWEGSRESPVQVSRVEEWLDEMRKKFEFKSIVVDKYQMVGTIQKFQGVLPMLTWEARGGKGNLECAQALRTAVVNKQLAWGPGIGDVVVKNRRGDMVVHSFVDELTELTTKELSYGYRLTHSSSGHDDRAIAVAMPLVQLFKDEVRRPLLWGENFW